MANRRVELELRVKEAEAAIAKLKAFGRSGEQAFKQISGSAKAVPSSLRATDAAMGSLRQSADGLLGRLGPLGAVSLARLPGQGDDPVPVDQSLLGRDRDGMA